MYSNFMLDFMSYFVLGYNVTASVKGRACAKLLRTVLYGLGSPVARRQLLVSELDEAGNC